MSLGILQISDIHCQPDRGFDLLGRVQKICSAIKPRCRDLKSLLLIISGDISNSGKSEQFHMARQFIDSLVQKLRAELQLEVLGPILVPGNHDCDFAMQGDVRPVLIKTISQTVSAIDLNGQKVQEMTKVHDQFFEFERSYSGVSREAAARLYYSYVYESGGKSILIHCFNTAWVSDLPEAQGNICFPFHVTLEGPTDRPLLSVSVFHHPYEWFDPVNRRQFRKVIEKASDIVLTGHEHEGDSFSRKSSEGANVSYIEGAAFSASGTNVGFNLVVISVETQTSQVFKFIETGAIYEPKETIEVQFLRNSNLLTSYFENNAEFEEELLNCPVSFSSSYKENLRIKDIFVYPDLKARSFFDKKASDIKSDGVLSFVADKRLVQIVGPAMSGKTTMSRKLYTDLREAYKYVPILIDGEEISGKPAAAFVKQRDKAFAQQYSKELSEAFIQLPSNKKALIIDDWHRAKLNTAGKTEFLSVARTEFNVVVTLGAEQSWFQDMIEASVHNQISEFQHCEIREFGHRLREEILMKWHSLGQEYDLEKPDLVKNVARSGTLLNGVLGKGLFPSFPLFILYTLQILSVEQGNVRAHGSYGHVYEAFITKRLAPISQKSTDVGTYYTYLSLIAYELFVSNKKSLSQSEMAEVHSRFVKDYDVPWEMNKVLSNLATTGILGEMEDGFGFLPKYCYYFFVAKFFQKALGDRPHDDDLRQELKNMAEMVHDDDYMNILIFYIYLTEDRQLIEFFIEQAKSIFAEHEACRLREDVDFLDVLLQRRDLDLATTNVLKNRSDFGAQKDEALERMESAREATVRTRYDKALDVSVKIDFANHSLQVMGQVLKNFPGDIKADLKTALAEQSYLLGLRTMSGILTVLRENADLICHLLEQMILVHRAKREAAATVHAGKVFARLAESSIFGMIKRVSTSLGLEDLSMTYSTVRKKLGEENLSARMIDLSIQLDHFSKMPHPDIKDLTHATRSHIVAYNILLMLVMEHLHLFEVDYKDRQKVSKLLGAGTQNTLLTEKMFKTES